jgi:hypothetical protein
MAAISALELAPWCSAPPSLARAQIWLALRPPAGHGPGHVALRYAVMTYFPGSVR